MSPFFLSFFLSYDKGCDYWCRHFQPGRDVYLLLPLCPTHPTPSWFANFVNTTLGNSRAHSLSGADYAVRYVVSLIGVVTMVLTLSDFGNRTSVKL
jgi:hypothetical protein